ncbi:MAG: hypothetical protein IPP48_05940 [Chitinophagaceae bacterium]|nr:hypothetical protein [Chitinophagaceae bacterium]
MALKQLISQRTFQISYSVIIVIFVIGVAYSLRNLPSQFKESKKKDREFCEEEYKLSLNGVITDYSGLGIKSRPIQILLDDSLVKIPRYNTEMYLYVGDTIIKQARSHIYYIYRNWAH